MRTYFFIILIFSSIHTMSQQRGVQNLDNRGSENKGEKSRTILDDSTKTIYGMNTSTYISKDNFLSGDTTFITLDSSLTNIEKTSFDEKNYFTYQSLGNIGTPLNNIFNYNSSDFSVVPGINSLDKYYLLSSEAKFYDTKSPYIDLSLFFGGNGRSMVDFVFSRNINKNWNIGFDIHRISADKQVAASKAKGDKNINSSLFKLFIYHKSNDEKLTLYSDFVSFRHQILGNGGVDVLTDSLPLEFFIYNDFNTRLNSIENLERRKRFNVFINYKLVDGLEIYNDFKYNTQQVDYLDENYIENSAFYNNFFNNNNFTSDSIKINSLNNRAGIRGLLGDVNYNFYANYKTFNYRYTDDLESNKFNEFYLGGIINLSRSQFDILADFKLKTTGDYSLLGKIESKILDISYYSGLHVPTLFHTSYSGNHFEWDNDFNSSFINSLEANLKVSSKHILFSPFIRMTSVKDYIYFSNERLPTQHNEVLFNNQFGINFNINFFNKTINLESRYSYNTVSKSSDEILSLPKHHLYSRLYYNGLWFDNSIPVQFGVNAYLLSEYYGNAYEPSLQTFYVQNNFLLENNLRFNLFYAMQVKNFRVFLKMTHFSQFDKFDGYFVTPYYPAQKKVLDLGVKWYFFN